MVEFIGEIFNVVFGGYTGIEVFGFSWFLLIGYIIYGLNETGQRDGASRNTPRKWSWKFWINDNWRRYLATILTTYVFFIFYEDFVGHALTNFEAVMIGLIGDGIGATAKKRVNIVKGDRVKLMANMPKEEENELG